MNNSPYDAIQLLSEVDWSNEHTRQLIGTYIELFYMDYKDDQSVIDALQEQAKVLAGEAQQTIQENIRLVLEV